MEYYKEFKPKDINDFTKNTLTGNGVFDRMMNAVELHIQDEYKKNRITGANYANVYLSAMQAVLQTATQFTLSQDESWINLEKLKLEREKLAVEIELQRAQLEVTKAELEIKKAELEINKAKLEQEKANIPLIQAKTRDIVDNGEECYEGSISNIHGELGQQIAASKATIDNANKAASMQLAKEFCVSPFATIEASEGVGASYYGLNGGNTIDYLNNLRDAFGMKKLDTKKYSGEHENYRNCWAPGVSIGEESDSEEGTS